MKKICLVYQFNKAIAMINPTLSPLAKKLAIIFNFTVALVIFKIK